ARVLRAELPDRIRVGRAKSLERDRVEPVLRLEIAGGTLVDRIRIGRHDGDTARSEGLNGAADRLRRRDRRNAGTDTHPLRDDVVVVLGKETCRRLSQDHHLDPGRSQQARLIVDVLVSAGRETPGATGHEAPDVRLVSRRQESTLHLDRRIRGRNQDAEMPLLEGVLTHGGRVYSGDPLSSRRVAMTNDALRTIFPIACWGEERARAVEITGGTDPILPTSFRIAETSVAALAAT